MMFRYQINMVLWMLLLLMITDGGISASINVSSFAKWSRNGVTVAGQANGVNGSGIGYLKKNEGIFIADDDTLYIGDAENNRIVIVQLNSLDNVKVIESGGGSNSTKLNYPSAAFVTNTSIYVTDTGNNRVLKYSRNATDSMTMPGSSFLELAYALFVDKYENLYLSDANTHKVICFAPNSSVPTTVAGIGKSGSSAMELSIPIGIFVDDERTVYVADFYNHRIQKWTNGASAGITVTGTGLPGTGLAQLRLPKWVIVDVHGYKYVVDDGNARIMRYAPGTTTGVCIIACLGRQGIGAHQLRSPVGLAFDSMGSIYVSDMSNSRVQKFQILSDNDEDKTTIAATSKSTTDKRLTNTTKLVISSTSMRTSPQLLTSTASIPTAVITSSTTSIPTAVITSSTTSIPTAVITSSTTSIPTAVITSSTTSIPTAVITSSTTSIPTAVITSSTTSIPTAVTTSSTTSSPTAVTTSSTTSIPTAMTTSSTATSFAGGWMIWVWICGGMWM